MKNKLYLTILILTSAFFQLGAQNEFHIKGKIKGLQDTTCMLGYYFGKFTSVKDTTEINSKGEFEFKYKEALPGGIYLIVFPNKTSVEFILDKDQVFTFETDTAKRVESMKIKGSEDNEAFYKYLNFINAQHKLVEPIRKRITALRQDSTRAESAKKDSIKILEGQSSKIDKAVENFKLDYIKQHHDEFLTAIFKSQKDVDIPEIPILSNGRPDSLFRYLYYKDHFWDGIPPHDERLLRTPVFHMKLTQFFESVVIQNPDSIINEAERLIAKTNGNKETFKYIVWYLTTTYETSKIMGMDAVFVHLVNKYYRTGMAHWVDTVTLQKIIHRVDILEPLLLGKPAPNIVMQDTSGNNLPLHDVKAKYLVLVFYDPDCGHCKKVMPVLFKEYSNKLKAKGARVFAVDIEDDEKKWKDYINEQKFDWINARDKGRRYFLRDMYDIYSTPVIYILDENKKIRAKRIDAEQIDGFLDFMDKMEKPKESGNK